MSSSSTSKLSNAKYIDNVRRKLETFDDLDRHVDMLIAANGKLMVMFLELKDLKKRLDTNRLVVDDGALTEYEEEVCFQRLRDETLAKSYELRRAANDYMNILKEKLPLKGKPDPDTKATATSKAKS